jgi:murein DD-endopeptidase MepM/ murein hydrolase activator NlpD
MYMPSGSKLITAVLTIPLSAALAMTTTIAPAIASTAEVAERAEAAKEAQAVLDEAAEKSTKADKSLNRAESRRKKATKRLTKAAAAVEDASKAVESATDEATVTRAEVEQALSELEELERETGVIDVAAEAGNAITGESDSDLLAMAGGFLTAGLASVVGPAVQALTPATDAANEWAEHADHDLRGAQERAELAQLEILAATEAERTATVTLVQAEWTATDARAALREVKQVEKEASSKQEDAAAAKDKAAAAAKKATKKLRKAEAVAEAEAEAKRKAEAKKKAEAEAAAAQREEAASGTSRSLDGGRTTRPGTGGITSPYGMRTHPITGVYKLHSGTDFAYGDGRAYAARSGTVTAVTYDGAYGNMVTVSHGDGIETRYAHLSSASVSTGQKVGSGDVVGQIGSTGYATGPHLHFEVLQNGEFVNSATWLGL